MNTTAISLLAFATTNLALAQLPSPHLRSLHPSGAQIGSTVDVTIAGSQLDGTNGLLFSHPDINAERIVIPATEFHPEHSDPSRFRISVGQGVPAGEYQAHAITRLGLSSPRPFIVGIFDEAVEPGHNKDASGAFELKKGTVVNARADGDSIDYFRFKAKQGQRLLVQCWAERIGSKMDATLAIDDSSGRELLSDRDTLGRDPILDFIAPKDGDYLLRVFDLTYGGGDEFYYRLMVNEAPHIDFIVPPAGKPGTTGRFTLYGRNLPGGSKGEGIRLGSRELESIEVEIQIPKESQSAHLSTEVREALLPGFDYRLKAKGGLSNPVRIGLTTAPVVIEHEPGADQPVVVPAEIQGRFDSHSDADRFLFDASKDTPLWIECIAGRLGVMCDPLLVIERQTVDEKGNKSFAEIQSTDDSRNPGGRHFPTATRDPALSFSPPADGLYRLTLLNQSGRGGPGSQYRLIIRPHQPGFDLVATGWKPHRESKLLEPVPPLLRQGGTSTFRILAFRREGFSEEIIVEADNLPEGVSCPKVSIPSGQNSAILVLKCSDDAPDWNGFITIKGKGGDSIQTARAGMISWGVSNYETERVRSRLTTRIPLSVCTAEKAPVVITHPDNSEWNVELNGKLDIPVELLKRNPLKGDFVIQPEGSLFLKNPPQLKIKESESKGVISINFVASNDFPVKPGVWQFTLRGDGLVKYRNNPAAASRAEEASKRLTELKGQLDKHAKEARAAAASAQQVLKEAMESLQNAVADAKPRLQEAADQARLHFETKDQMAKDAEAKASRAESERVAAEGRTKKARERAQEKDVKISTYSLPITVRVTAPDSKKDNP